jgi:hypothetical protein
MPRDDELDRFQAEQDRAFQRKQDTWEAQDRAWKRLQAAREALNRRYQEKQDANEGQQRAWDGLQRVRDRNGSRIDYLNGQQETAYQNMRNAFDRASSAHDARDGASARMHADEGHRYKAESQEAVAERRRLIQEISDAKARHEAARPGFQRAKAGFDLARTEHEQAKAEHVRTQAEFKRAKSDFDGVKNEFQARLKVVRAKHKQRKDHERSLADRAGVPYQYRDNVYVSTGSDGTVNIYFGGIGSPDGPGHGHYAMDARGNVTYRRDPYDPHGTQNFTDHDKRPSTVFSEKAKSHRPERIDMYYSNEGEFEKDELGNRLYGHVTETGDPDGDRTYHYVRDEDENVYVDDTRNKNR